MSSLEDELKVYWINLCTNVNIINNDIINDIYKVIVSMYNENSRYYHTLEHIKSMLQLSDQYQLIIKDMISLQFAIFFHDIIYNAKSGTNEEDSVILFVKLLSNHIDQTIIDKVSRYIMSTKSHQISDDNDNDEKLFLDFDMAVLSWPRDKYLEYAKCIRKEFIHVEINEFCIKRSKFLRDTTTAKKIYHSQYYANNEQIAIDNMDYECRLLEQKQIKDD